MVTVPALPRPFGGGKGRNPDGICALTVAMCSPVALTVAMCSWVAPAKGYLTCPTGGDEAVCPGEEHLPVAMRFARTRARSLVMLIWSM
jgi:hypothetical protein